LSRGGCARTLLAANALRERSPSICVEAIIAGPLAVIPEAARVN
jgi:hypothetical protein